MLTETKIKETRRRLRNGEPEGEIREQLKRDGYSQQDIDTVFRPHHYDMRSWYFSFAILITLAGLYIAAENGSLLILLLGILLFGAYSREIKRLKKQ